MQLAIICGMCEAVNENEDFTKTQTEWETEWVTYCFKHCNKNQCKFYKKLYFHSAAQPV
jgi:uncharacterized CHY-type Zn-finger protein